MASPFLALLNRLRHTNRWSGMVSLQSEDVAQHSFSVALIAQMLCEIDMAVYNRQPDLGAVLSAALLHDASEAILTDVVAPVKKYSAEVETAFHHLEDLAREQMLNSLPSALKSAYEKHLLDYSKEVSDYVHAADKLDALTKCRLELRRGNSDFAIAAAQIQDQVQHYVDTMPCVSYFMEVFLPAFDRSVDEYRYLQPQEDPSSQSFGEQK